MKRKIKIPPYVPKYQGGGLNYIDTVPAVWGDRQPPQQIQPIGMQPLQNNIPKTDMSSLQNNNIGQDSNNQSGRMMGRGMGMVGTGYYASQQSKYPGDQTYNTTMGAVSQAGPIGGVIGGISAVGDAIGKPIRDKAEAVNSNTGGYENLGRARRTAVVGSMFNPFKALTTKLGGGMNYKKQDRDMRYNKQVKDWEQSVYTSNSNRRGYNYQPTFPNGGILENLVHAYTTPFRQIGKQRLYDTITPDEYTTEGGTFKDKIKPVLTGDTTKREQDDPYSEDAWAMYLGLPQKHNTMTKSKYTPKGNTGTYYALPEDFKKDLMKGVKSNLSNEDMALASSNWGKDYNTIKMNLGDDKKAKRVYDIVSKASKKYKTAEDFDKASKLDFLPTDQEFPYDESMMGEAGTFGKSKGRGRVLGNFSVSKHVDEKGRPYMSYRDRYDLHPLAKTGVKSDGTLDKVLNSAVGNPYNIYDRVYYNPDTYEVEEPGGGAGGQWAYGGMYQVGGSGYGNAELEDDEIFRVPDGTMEKVNGRSHVEGGEMYNLPQHTEILGKNIAPNGKSYKDNGDKLMRQYRKYTRILNDKPTSLAKRTAKMMLDKVDEGYTELMNQQEMEKQDNDNNPMYAYGGLIPEYKRGGIHIKPKNRGKFTAYKKRTGKTTEEALHSSNPHVRKMAQFAKNARKWKHADGGEIDNILNKAGTYAPIAYNIGQGLFGKAEQLNPSDYYNPYENQVMSLMRSRRYNVDPELEANRMATANYYKNLREGAPSKGQYMAGLQSGQVSQRRGDAEAYVRKQNIDNSYIGEEAQTLGGFGQQRASTKYGVADVNAANKASQRRYMSTGLSQLQQAVQMNQIMAQQKEKMRNETLRDQERERLMKDYFKYYNFDFLKDYDPKSIEYKRKIG